MTRVHWQVENAERQVFASTLYMADEQKENCWQEILKISQQVPSSIFQKLFTTWAACLQADGHYFEHVLWLKVQII